jgi:flagellar protein FlaG
VIRPLDAIAPSPTTVAGGTVVAADRPAPATPQVAETAPSRASVQAAVDYVNAALAASNRSIEFSIDPDVKTVVVRVIDKQDGSIVRQMPSQEMLAIAKALDQINGLLLRNRA